MALSDACSELAEALREFRRDLDRYGREPFAYDAAEMGELQRAADELLQRVEQVRKRLDTPPAG